MSGLQRLKMFSLGLLLGVLSLISLQGVSCAEDSAEDSAESKGHVVPISKYPFMASIESRISSRCSGAIISRKHLLTVASCVHRRRNPYALFRQKLIARVGCDTALKGGVVHPITKIHVHPNYYNSTDSSYNVVVLQVLKNIKFNKKVKPIEIPNCFPNEGDHAFVVGYKRQEDFRGVTSRNRYLQGLKVTIADHSNCQTLMETAKIDELCTNFEKMENHPIIFTGSALVFKGKVVGMLSSHQMLDDHSMLSMYTNMVLYKFWVEDIMRSMILDTQEKDYIF